MPWHTVESIVEQNQTRLPYDRLSKIESSNEDGLGEPRANFERILRLRRNQQAGKPITMFEALYLSAHAQATDARDKLYALLGLAFDGARLVPHPNYNLLPEDVYRHFSSELLQRGYPLDVVHLRSVRRGVESFSPSWVVDWRNLSKRSLLVVFVRISTFLKSDDASNKNVIGNYRAQGALLIAHGVTTGHVRSVTQVLGEGSDQSAIEAKVFVAKCHLQKAYTCSVFQPVKDPNNAFRLADTSASDFQYAVCTQLSTIMGLPERERTSSLRAYLAAHRTSFGKVEEENNHSSHQGSSDSVELNDMRVTEEEFLVEQVGSAILDGMLIALYEGTIIGCVLSQSKSGDVIVALSGCTIPVLLRKRESQGYEVVGTAWIYGQINDEVSFSEQPTEKFEIF